MPDNKAFLSGFGFTEGIELGGYKLLNAVSTHDTVKRWQEYSYSITLTFKDLGNGSYSKLFNEIHNLIVQEHIIYGIRNPYNCTIDYPKDGDVIEDNYGYIIFKLHGHGYRL